MSALETCLLRKSLKIPQSAQILKSMIGYLPTAQDEIFSVLGTYVRCEFD